LPKAIIGGELTAKRAASLFLTCNSLPQQLPTEENSNGVPILNFRAKNSVNNRLITGNYLYVVIQTSNFEGTKLIQLTALVKIICEFC
jgi:hypothetical protein